MSATPTSRAHTLLVGGDDRPPVILVHGAANSGCVRTFWRDELARHGWSSHAIDLRGHGASAAADLGITRMADYADDVIAFARTLRQAPVVVGWSMGGLVAMMAAMLRNAWACVGLAPSTSARVFDASVALRIGVFGPEEYVMESRMVRDERKAGIVIARRPVPDAGRHRHGRHAE